MGLGQLHHPRRAALPEQGAHLGLDLPLGDDFHAAGDSGPACRGGDVSPAGAVRDCTAHPACPSDYHRGHEHARQGAAHGSRAEEGKQLPEVYQSDCGAVNPTRTLAPDLERRFSTFSPWQGSGYPCSADPSYHLTAVFRLIRFHYLPISKLHTALPHSSAPP